MIGKTMEELQLGDTAYQEKTITEEDVRLFGEITGDKNPAHFDEEYAKTTMFKTRISHGMLVGSLFSKVIGMDLPGKGTIYLTQNLRFRRTVFLGDTIKATVTITQMDTETGRVTLETSCKNKNGEQVIVGDALVMPPKKG